MYVIIELPGSNCLTISSEACNLFFNTEIVFSLDILYFSNSLKILEYLISALFKEDVKMET